MRKSKRLGEILNALIWFWSGIMVGWLIFTDVSVLEVLAYQVMGLAIFIIVFYLIRIILENKRR